MTKRIDPNVVIGLALILAVFAVFGRAIHHDFINYDDNVYVYENPHVVEGFTAESIQWAFTESYAANWHPVTWLSHMLDCQLFGLNPTGHHLTSVVLHAVNAALMFAVMLALTGRRWPSALVAALFALHPLRVESVAWVAERKDLLCATFGLLAIWAYAAYARRGGIGRYLLVFAAMALSLMSKPMLVTLPFVLLLLDYWPLGRLSMTGRGGRLGTILEKLPLLALSAIACIITYLTQKSDGAMDAADAVPMPVHLANAVVSYVRYLGNAFWPTKLSVYYTHPNLPGGMPWTAWQIIGAAALLIALTAVAWRYRRHGYPLVGWLWFLGTLVPVIGVIKVGDMAMADRFTYIPLTGIAIIIAFAITDSRLSKIGLGGRLREISIVTLFALSILTTTQLAHWRNSITLYQHALAVSPSAPLLHSNLGMALKQAGRVDEGIRHYRQAIHHDPDYQLAHHNLANALLVTGQIDEAIAHYQKAIARDGDYMPSHVGLAIAYEASHRYEASAAAYRRALKLEGNHGAVHIALAVVLTKAGRYDESLDHMQRAIDLNPHHAKAAEALALDLKEHTDTAKRRHAAHLAELASAL